MNKLFSALAVFMLVAASLGRAEENDLIPLKSAAPGGLGLMTVPSLSHEILGTAFVYGSARPDLFVAASKKSGLTLHLFRWLRDAPDGSPIFGPPMDVPSPHVLDGAVFQLKDGTIHGIWASGKKLIHAVFDRKKTAFEAKESVPLSFTPHEFAVFPNEDGSLDIAYQTRDPVEQEPEEEAGGDKLPYDSAGISSRPMRYGYIRGFRLPGLLKGPSEDRREISPVTRDVPFGITGMTPVTLQAGRPRGLVAGTRMGNLNYYPDPFGTEAPARRLLIAGPDGVAMRHPSISPRVCAWPNADGTSDLLTTGEGGFYYYRFADRFTSAGAPVFENPVQVQQEGAFLFPGKLPVPTVIDWDGDGVLDILSGNSEGYVIFFKNAGTNDEPAFLPGKRLQAGGEDIHVQAGYSGSIQGLQEARWGYTSPIVGDWTGDGLPDIIMGDITGNYTVYVNRGTKTAPALDPAQPIYCDGINLRGMWRSRAAVAKLGDRYALAIVDGEDHFHLYWKIDDFNVEDGGKLTLADGSPIVTSYDPGGGTGRCKPDFFDYDGDGVLDLIIGTGRRSAIPDKQAGYPLPILGKRTLGTPLFMKNIGSNAKPVFARPAPFSHAKAGLVQPGGAHETGAVATPLGGNGPNLLVASETGYLYLLRGAKLSLLTPEQAAQYRDRRNSLPAP